MTVTRDSAFITAQPDGPREVVVVSLHHTIAAARAAAGNELHPMRVTFPPHSRMPAVGDRLDTRKRGCERVALAPEAQNRGQRRTFTADDLRAALAKFEAVEPACVSLGVTKQAAYQRPDLRPVLDAWRALQPPTGTNETRARKVCLDPAVIDRLDGIARARRAARHPNATRSGVARDMLHGAVKPPPPEPAPAGGRPVTLDLGTALDVLLARLGPRRAGEATGVIRAILRVSEVSLVP